MLQNLPIMLQNLPIMLSGISFFLPIIPKIMLTASIILQIMLIYLHIILWCVLPVIPYVTVIGEARCQKP